MQALRAAALVQRELKSKKNPVFLARRMGRRRLESVLGVSLLLSHGVRPLGELEWPVVLAAQMPFEILFFWVGVQAKGPLQAKKCERMPVLTSVSSLSALPHEEHMPASHMTAGTPREIPPSGQ